MKIDAHLSVKNCPTIKHWMQNNYSQTHWYHIGYSYIDVNQGLVQPLHSDERWHISYFEAELQNVLFSRLVPGFHSWSDLSVNHAEALKLIDPKLPEIRKFDLCVDWGKGIYEMVSFATLGAPTEADYQLALQARHQLSFFALKARKKFADQCFLEFPLDDTMKKTHTQPAGQCVIDCSPTNKYHFNGLILTQKDLDIITHKCFWQTNKETAAALHVSEAYIQQRLDELKIRMGLQGRPRSELYHVLFQLGVIDVCRNRCTTSH